VPCLFIGGTADPVLTFTRADRASEIISGPYRQVMIDGAGIGCNRSDPTRSTRPCWTSSTDWTCDERPAAVRRLYHAVSSVGQSPTVALEYDMERVVALDRLGFDEAWFGEHHSGGYELIACPEIFIAAARSGPSTSGWAPEWSRCPTTIR